MAVDKNNPVTDEVTVEEEKIVTLPGDTEEAVQEESQQDFYANLAEDMDDRILSQIANDLLFDYEKDKESRQDWEDAYIKGLDLLGFK